MQNNVVKSAMHISPKKEMKCCE